MNAYLGGETLETLSTDTELHGGPLIRAANKTTCLSSQQVVQQYLDRSSAAKMFQNEGKGRWSSAIR